jgi:hypothetical protein
MRWLEAAIDEALPWITEPRLGNTPVRDRTDAKLPIEKLRKIHAEAMKWKKHIESAIRRAELLSFGRDTADFLDPTPISGTYEGVTLIGEGRPILGAVIIGVSLIPILGPRVARGLGLVDDVARAGRRTGPRVASNPRMGRFDFEHTSYDKALESARRNAGDLGTKTQKM